METEFRAVPIELLERVKDAAADEEITPEESVREAVEAYLDRTQRDKILAFGLRHAKKHGLMPEYVDEAIAAVRAESAR